MGVARNCRIILLTMEVLVLDNAGHPNSRARLHADGCPALRMFSAHGRRGLVLIREDVAALVLELETEGYPVKRCKCLTP